MVCSLKHERWVERHDEHLFCEKVVGGSKFWRKWRGVLVMPLLCVGGYAHAHQMYNKRALFNSFRCHSLGVLPSVTASV